MEIRKILSIDDDPFIHELICKGLQSNAPEVELEQLSETQNYWNVLNSFQPDVLLLDYMMPEMDGPALIADMRRQNLKTPVIFLTASCEDEEKLIEFGAIGVIRKPINPKKLWNQIKAVFP